MADTPNLDPAALKSDKLTLIAYKDADCTEATGDEFSALINPEKILFNKKIKYVQDTTSGTDKATLKFDKVESPDLDLEFLFDGTGLISGGTDVDDQIKKFTDVLTKYEGENHQIKYIKVLWGKALFKGAVTDFSIEHKLFKRDGATLRAIGKVKLKETISEELGAVKKNNESPDLTHLRQVIEGDTLPRMTYKIYGDSKYYLEVAKFNNLTNFRKLIPGQQLYFPPIDKLA